MVERRTPKDDPRSFARQLTAYGAVGTMFPVAIGIGFLSGYYLDGKLGTGPWLALSGFALGVTAALRNLLRASASLEPHEQQGDNQAGSHQQMAEHTSENVRDDD